ncbi:General transcription factor IIE subunit 2 [Intoshia linei]|uniref:Transcription initiation factor IIE subunit beta n=1 Tax=Intoshia linei TaxID=1819745 RepID=A0A177B9C1_9BILA|nr:General transcription factor IIE subunit 2 [Intoshia linei]
MKSNHSKEVKSFRKRAMNIPTVENRKEEIKKPKFEFSVTSKSLTTDSTSSYKFSVLAKCVRHMKKRHLTNMTTPLGIDEIMNEINITNTSAILRRWLVNEAFISNERIKIVDGKYAYQPPFDIKDAKTTLKLLRHYWLKMKGGVPIKLIEESLPNYEKVIQRIQDHIVTVNTTTTKKPVVFFKDTRDQLKINDEIKNLWKTVKLDGMDDIKISDYITSHHLGQPSQIIRKVAPKQKKQQNKPLKSNNEHLTNKLLSMSEMTQNKN